jgi:hypothetical protein
MLSTYIPATSLDSPRATGMALDSATVHTTYPTELNDTDVLTGRGAAIDRFPGNVRFRSLIKSKKEAYSDASRPTEKNIVAREVIQAVHDSSGRFLKREGTSTAVHSDTLWVLMEDAAIVEKVKQALRDCAKEAQKSKLPNEKSPRCSTCKKMGNPSRVSRILPSAKQAPLRHETAVAPHEPNTDGVAGPPHHPVSTSTPVSLDDHHHHSPATVNNTIDHQLLARSLLDLRNKMVPPMNRPNQTDVASPSATLDRGVWGIEGSNNRALSFASQIPLLPPPTATATNSLAVHTFLPQSLLLPSAPWAPLVTARVQGLALPSLTPTTPTVSQTWREIPNSYISIFLGPLSNSTTGFPFTSADLDILWRTKNLAEATGDVLCLAKIRAVLQAVLHLPLSRLHLTAIELHLLGDLLRNGTESNGGRGTLYT